MSSKRGAFVSTRTCPRTAFSRHLAVLRRAGVDLTTPDPVRDTLDLFESLLGQLEAHVAEHGAAGAVT